MSREPESPMPCPFCGSTALTVSGLGVKCDNCSAWGPLPKPAGVVEAVEAWNWGRP